MMDTVERLVQDLGRDYTPDYWYDHAKFEAGKMIDELDDEQWLRLEKIWREQPVNWQIHFVEASHLSEKPRVVNLLVKMLASPEAQVGSAVAEMLLEKNYRWSPQESLLADLERHLRLASPEEQVPIKRLISRLPA
jgi:hypothetical protein